ncbi:hypothetical protein [Flavobacterium celericrescens]|uniref:Uncharacterized protein n=1 Tax=Flavobacterium celericrescens TaxID=2709780 RepID=A0ABX0IAS4_9FLAO|nr:hypothetical protein [Flavobacterium celericrescens]NHM04204.1 hypothetical protein [Flavobacterium celericrescens]
MKAQISFFFLLFSLFTFGQVPHCGFDFTSYLVVKAHEEGKTENIPDLKITLVNEKGEVVINENNKYSWKFGNQALIFSKNYIISKQNEAVKWFFPYAGDTYLLSVTNTFPAEDFYIKIEDNKAIYKTQILQLQAFNMYILCSSENERQARTFGPRSNNPIEVVMEKNN